MVEYEKRTFEQSFEIRDGEQGGHIISGYAVVFDSESRNMGFIETIDPHAFDSVDMSEVLCLYNHEFSNILSRTDEQTLKLNVDKRGLAFTSELPQTTLGNDVYINISNGNVRGCSFGFDVDSDEWDENDQGISTRRILKFGHLFEVSLCPVPAYPETSVQAQRSFEQYRRSRQVKERLNLWLDLKEKLEKE